MEDAHAHVLPLEDNDSLSFFGVFDGHGGTLAARFAAKHLLTYIRVSDAFEDLGDELDPTILAKSMSEGFIDCDEDLKEFPLCKSGEDYSGSTGVASFISPSHIIVANTGDSRACLCKQNDVSISSIDAAK